MGGQLKLKVEVLDIASDVVLRVTRTGHLQHGPIQALLGGFSLEPWDRTQLELEEALVVGRDLDGNVYY